MAEEGLRVARLSNAQHGDENRSVSSENAATSGSNAADDLKLKARVRWPRKTVLHE
jgi:hypothetical protein